MIGSGCEVIPVLGRATDILGIGGKTVCNRQGLQSTKYLVRLDLFFRFLHSDSESMLHIVRVSTLLVSSSISQRVGRSRF